MRRRKFFRTLLAPLVVPFMPKEKLVGWPLAEDMLLKWRKHANNYNWFGNRMTLMSKDVYYLHRRDEPICEYLASCKKIVMIGDEIR